MSPFEQRLSREFIDTQSAFGSEQTLAAVTSCLTLRIPIRRYVPLIGLFMAATWGLGEVARHWSHRTLVPLLAGGIVIIRWRCRPACRSAIGRTAARSFFEIAPVLLKNEGRVEALFFVYFLALLIQALIERELRRAMAKRAIPNLPLIRRSAQTHD